MNWTDSDAHSNVTPPSGTRAPYNGGNHFRLMSGRDGAAGLAAGANVQVDRGATLDCSRVTGGQTVSSLTVDCAGGMGDGTLVNVAFAAAGEVRLVNFPADTPLVNFELPLVFTDAADLRNVRGWTLYVDGVKCGSAKSPPAAGHAWLNFLMVGAKCEWVWTPAERFRGDIGEMRFTGRNFSPTELLR